MKELYSSPADWVLCGVGGFGLLPLCKDKEGGHYHLHSSEPVVGESTAEEVRQYVKNMGEYHSFLTPVAYFCPPEEYWAGQMEEARIKMEQTGSRLLPEPERRIRYLGKREALFCQTFSGRVRVYEVISCRYQYLGYDEDPETKDGYLVDLSWDGIAGHQPARGTYFLASWNDGQLNVLASDDDDNYVINWSDEFPLYSIEQTASGCGCGPVDDTKITRRNRLIRQLRRRLSLSQ